MCLHRQVAREVRDNLAPDALVLSVVVGLARKRQAQLLGIEETRLFRIAAPETESVEATYHEFVRAAAHQRADAGVADGAGGGGEQAGDGAGGVGKRQETAAGLELDEGHRAESGAVLSTEDKTNGVSAPPPPAPVSTADSAVPQKTAIPCPRTLSIKVRLSPGMVLRPRVSSWVRASVGLIISAEATEAKRVLTVEAMVMHTLVTQEVKE